MFIHEPIDLGYVDLEANTTSKGRTYNIPTGEKYPSITSVLSILSEDSIRAWRARVGEVEANKISHRASTRGTSVHEIIEKYLNNEPDFREGYMPNIIESFNSVKDVLDERIGKIYAQECPLYSDHLRVAGRVDCVAEFDGKNSIIDFKTSKKLKRKDWIESYFMQETFYCCALYERTGIEATQLVTIISVDDEEPQIFIESMDKWLKPLVDTINKYNARQTMKVMLG